MTRAGLAAVWAFVAMAIGPAAPAVAEPTQLVAAPARWRADPEQSSALAQRVGALRHFGGMPAVTAVEAYVAERPGAALFATRATAALPGEPAQAAQAAQAARAARAAIDELRASSRRTQLAGGAAQEQAWQERVETQARQVTATLTWRDPASRSVETARVVVASDGKRIAAVTGECVSRDDADPGTVAACQAALATLDPGIPAASRVALALAPPSDAGPPSNAAPARRSQPGMSAAPGDPAEFDDRRAAFPPMVIPQGERAIDRRPAYVGAGLIALAVMFWWNRRRRDRFEREDRGSPARPAHDDEADELRAAARGEALDLPDAPDAPDRPDRNARPDPPDPPDPRDRP